MGVRICRSAANFIRDMKIQKKLMSIYIIVVLIPILIVGIIFTKGMQDMAVDRSINEASINSDRIQRNLENLLKDIGEVSNRIYLDEELEHIASTKYKTRWEVVQDYWSYNEFNVYMRYYKEISSIRYYVDNDTLLDNWEIIPVSSDIKGKEWYKKAIAANTKIAWQYVYDERTSERKLALTRQVKNKYLKHSGVLVIMLDNKYLKDTIESEPYETIVTLGGDEIILSHDVQNGIKVDKTSLEFIADNISKNNNEVVYNGVKSIVINKSFNNGQNNDKFNIITVIPLKSITKKAAQIGRLGSSIIIPSIILTIILIWFFSRIISRRIIFLRREMNKVVKGDFNISTKFKGKDEIGELYEDLNLMIASIKQLIHEVYEERLIKEQLKNRQREIEFKMLASQINPHFLYNTLETIRMKAHFNGQEEIVGIVKRLGKLMRRSLEVKNTKVSLESEIEMIKSYLEIQKARFEDRVDYIFKVNTDIDEFYVIPLLLQPIVENAFVHGFEGKGDKGVIEVNIDTCDDKLVVSISDNGGGIEEARLSEIKQSLEEDRSEIEGSIGLCNVNARVKLYYGTQYGIDIESKLNEGTRVSIHLPLAG